MQHEAFTSGKFDTHFVKKYFQPENLQQENESEAMIAALVAAQLIQQKPSTITHQASGVIATAWKKNRTQF